MGRRSHGETVVKVLRTVERKSLSIRFVTLLFWTSDGVLKVHGLLCSCPKVLSSEFINRLMRPRVQYRVDLIMDPRGKPPPPSRD
jgi:hypothetical protein